VPKKETPKEAEPQPEAPVRQGGLSPKLMIVILGIMVAEAGAVVGFLSLTGPSHSSAAEHADLVVDAGEQTKEIMVVDERFQNLQSGRAWQWEIELWLKVKTKTAEAVQARLEAHKAEIQQAINNIISRSQHAHLKEPGHETLLRQLTQVMEDFMTPEGEEEPLFETVILPKVRGHPTDF
jgi:flagellar basal body-associated protein FliL